MFLALGIHYMVLVAASVEHDADRVATLQAHLADGEVSLERTKRHGYLPALLAALDVPASSQILVYSRTSLQADLISPERPRALYFNDEVYLGYVPDAPLVEISVSTRNNEAHFYTLSEGGNGLPVIRTESRCVQCHESPATLGVRGHLVRSVFPDSRGMPVLRAGTFQTFQTSPIEERWGGWFVTGLDDNVAHLGNRILPEEAVARRTALIQPGDLVPYPSPSMQRSKRYVRGGSDVAALMVFEHQVRMHNLFAWATKRTRDALEYRAALAGKLEDEELDTAVARRIQNAGDKVLGHMLFQGEARLRGVLDRRSAFVRDFEFRGERDARGRSLRDMHLRGRLFRYPLTYLIQTRAFDRLPAPLLDYLYRRLWKILSAREEPDEYRHLTPNMRGAILEILRDTKAELPDSWR